MYTNTPENAHVHQVLNYMHQPTQYTHARIHTRMNTFLRSFLPSFPSFRHSLCFMFCLSCVKACMHFKHSSTHTYIRACTDAYVQSYLATCAQANRSEPHTYTSPSAEEKSSLPPSNMSKCRAPTHSDDTATDATGRESIEDS